MLIAWQQPARGRKGRVVAICLGALVVAACTTSLIAIALAARAPAGPDAAKIIAGGEARAKAVAAKTDDPELAGDEAAAGAMWAKDNRPQGAASCPSYPAPFTKFAPTPWRSRKLGRPSPSPPRARAPCGGSPEK